MRGKDLARLNPIDGLGELIILDSDREVFDFLPEIKNSSPTDQAIFESWKNFFIEKRVPFIITWTKPGVKTMWKFKEV